MYIIVSSRFGCVHLYFAMDEVVILVLGDCL